MDETSIPDLSPEEARKARARARSQRYRLRHPERIPARGEMSEEERDRQRAMARERAQKDREKKRAQDRAYRQKNQDKLRAYRQKNQDKINARKRGYRLTADTETIAHRKALVSARNKRYRERHLEQLRDRGRAWYQNNPEHAQRKAAYMLRWQQANPDAVRLHNHRRLARKASAPINDFTENEWRALCKAVGYRCCYCGKKFAAKELTPDHLTPYNDKGSNTLHNVLPCCGSCNSRKGQRSVLKPVQPFLLLSDEEAAD